MPGRVDGGAFQGLPDALPQLGGRGFGKGDGGDAVHRPAPGRDQRDHAVDEAPGLAGARSRLDDHVFAEAFDDGVPRRLVGGKRRVRHRFSCSGSPSAIGTYERNRGSPRFRSQYRDRDRFWGQSLSKSQYVQFSVEFFSGLPG